jgi:peptidoglycan hydrolase-like protein with peptidoglycan-binding domain
MDYCRNCGEPLQGRFCRMCGTPTPGGPQAEATARQPGYDGGYGATQAGAPLAEPTQAFAAAAPAGYGAQTMGYGRQPRSEYGQQPQPGYPAEAPSGYDPLSGGYEPQGQTGYGPATQMLTSTPAEFDGLFRNEDGSPGAHGQTQLLPPVVEADYRMQAPGAAQQPPGGPAGPREPAEEEPRSNRPVILATVGAVVVATGVILGLLYLGNQGTSGGPASSGTAVAAGPTGAGSASQSSGVISLPTDGATLGPTATAPSTAADAGGFHGDSLPLGPGSSGSEVKWVQERLKSLGYYHGSTDGDFDQATALAVQGFQGAAGVTGDAASTVGLHTIVALESAGSTPNLRQGNRNSSVARLNAALAYATGKHLTGSRYTEATAAAVAEYQQAVGLQPTGQVTAATWAKLQDGTLATG